MTTFCRTAEVAFHSVWQRPFAETLLNLPVSVDPDRLLLADSESPGR